MFKKILLNFIAAFLLMNAAFSQSENTYKWWNPSTNSFPVIAGRGWHKDLASPYDRLPAKAEKNVRKAVWDLSQESAGLMIRFRSNASDIIIRYTVGHGLNMPHMPSTGVSGVDLYAINKDGKWEWDGGSYHFGDTIEYHFASLKNDYVREYQLYLPLYNKVKWMEIGVPDSTTMIPLPISPDKPIVVYGTSIAQGACASRPGMAWAAILGRRLHRPVINLGFSGNGRLEKPIVHLLTELDPKIYVVDCLPNMTGFSNATIANRLIETVKELHQKKPQVPLLIVEDADGNIGSLDTRRDKAYDRVNKIGDSVLTILKSSGIENIYILTAKEIGLDIESTVAGVHPNDYGMEKYASAYERVIRGILNEPTGQYSTTQPCTQYRSGAYDWNLRHFQELEMNKTNPPRIVFLGNSITHYWGGAPNCPIKRGEDSWKKYFDPEGVRNLGFSWDRIENVLWRVYHGELSGYKAKQIVINIGTNNLGHNSDKEIIAGLKLLINAVKERQPAVPILLLGIYPRKDGEKRVAELNKRILQLCCIENVNYANPGLGLLDKSGKIIPSLFVDKALHPNAGGYEILGRAIKPYLVQ